MRRWVLVMIALVIAAHVALAIEENMFVFAVTESGEGVPARLVVKVTPGSGHVSIDVGEAIVGESTQESVRNAIQAAANLVGVDWKNYDYYVDIISPSQKIDGPSAGLPMALCFYAAFEGLNVPQNVGATGQIFPDGTVGPVGGIFEKATAAHDVGIKIFLIPYGESNTPAKIEEEIAPGVVQKVETTVNIIKYAKQHWNMDVYEVKTLKDAVSIVFEGNAPEVNVPPEEHLPAGQFTPPPAPVNKSARFKVVAEKIVERAEKMLSDAQSCGQIPQSISNKVNIDLSSAQSMLKQAKKLVDDGYYYTAANYAFLALIDAREYYEICKHPSVIDPTSMAFQDLLDSVNTRLKSVEQLLSDVNISRENAEIVAGARERWIRAYTVLHSQKIDLKTLISADEWIWAAKEMLKDLNTESVTPIPDLQNLAKQWIISAQDVAVQSSNLPESVNERITWALEAYKRGWYMTAAMSAATARGLAVGYLVAKKENAFSTLSNLISNAFTPAGMWDELYLNHARYYYEAAKYFQQEGAGGKAQDMAETGIEMYYMAKDLHSVISTVQSAPIVKIREVEKSRKLTIHPKTLLLLAAVVLLISAIILLLARKKSMEEREQTQVKQPHKQVNRVQEHYEKRLREINRKIRALERKKKLTDKEKKELAKLKRLAGRYRSLLEKVKAR